MFMDADRTQTTPPVAREHPPSARTRASDAASRTFRTHPPAIPLLVGATTCATVAFAVRSRPANEVRLPRNPGVRTSYHHGHTPQNRGMLSPRSFPMAKLFYSLEEAADRLGKSPDQVREMAASGQLQEFRDRDRLMFKREQVDLIAGGGPEESGMIPLADDNEAMGLASSGTGSAIGLAGDSAKEQTGISIFDAESTDDADPSAVTRVTNAPGVGLMDPGKSGTGGMLDLTRESEDTGLGAGLLQDVYGGETVAQQTAAEPALGGDGPLFEAPTSGGYEMAAAAPVAMIAAEPYDGAGSGLVGGLAIGITISAAIAAFVVISGITSTAGGGLVATMAGLFMPLIGIMAGVTVVAAVLGWVLGRKS